MNGHAKYSRFYKTNINVLCMGAAIGSFAKAFGYPPIAPYGLLGLSVTGAGCTGFRNTAALTTTFGITNISINVYGNGLPATSYQCSGTYIISGAVLASGAGATGLCQGYASTVAPVGLITDIVGNLGPFNSNLKLTSPSNNNNCVNLTSGTTNLSAEIYITCASIIYGVPFATTVNNPILLVCRE